MQEVKDLWNAVGFHGEVSVPNREAIESSIQEMIRPLAFANPSVAIYRDIKYCVRQRSDGPNLVIYFELLR